MGMGFRIIISHGGGERERSALLRSPSLSFPLRKWLLALPPLLPRLCIYLANPFCESEGERESGREGYRGRERREREGEERER